MMMSRFCWIIIFFFFITLTTFFSGLPSVTSRQYSDDVYPTANLSTLWVNNRSDLTFADNSRVSLVLLRAKENTSDFVAPQYASGFYCYGTSDSCLFTIFAVDVNSYGGIIPSGSPQVVWSANRNNSVRDNATLELTAEGDLVLRDADGTLAWSTNTAGRSVAGLNLTDMGNLVLFNANKSVVWQSFDHPTDCLLPGQILRSGKNLTASASDTNWTEGGSYSLSMTDRGLVASILSDPPQVYYSRWFPAGTKQNKEGSYAKFQNGSLDLYITRVEPLDPDISITIPEASSARYMKLGPDGHLRVLQWVERFAAWQEVADITDHLGECSYPMVCGKYGICSNGQCTCPSGTSFRPIKDRQPRLGCSQVIPLTCNASDNHSFLDLDNVTDFRINFTTANISNTDMNTCKEACLRNCSCGAAVFRFRSDSSLGACYLPSQIFLLMNNEWDFTDYSSSVAIKVQIASSGKTSFLGPILGSTLGVICVAVAIGTTVSVHQRRRRRSEEVEEDYLDHVPGMPTRFSFEELVTATGNFTKKLGEGGFGSVFEGSLNDGVRIAVKRLDGVGYFKKSFLAEVETIGSIHHINLLRLIGFCAEKSHRLLVYEYMCNGSLNRWIYCINHETSLSWSYRRKIILDIAKGLAYLHEECRQKIIHLDIKPQNVLLDENYNAKLADFGLSKLIDRDQTQVVTTMRGTPGYLAPEWLSAVITEKVDVYSFGIVILEIVCGRKIFEQSRPEEERHLLTLFKKKAEEGQWLDLVDKCCQNVESNVAQIQEMMQISALCLRSDPEKRPSMSMVIKILESVNDVLKDIDSDILIPEVSFQDVSSRLPSVLSGPR